MWIRNHINEQYKINAFIILKTLNYEFEIFLFFSNIWLQNIRLELENSVACDDVVEEVVLLIGATSWSPREVYRILVPPISSAEPDQKINDSKILLKLIEYVTVAFNLLVL